MIFGSSAVSCGQAGRAGTDPVWYYKRIERPGLLFRVFVRGGGVAVFVLGAVKTTGALQKWIVQRG